FESSNTGVPPAFWADMRSEMRPQALIDSCIPVYAKHLSSEDLDGLLRFYESPVGKRVTDAMPKIAKETIDISYQWGESIGKLVEQRASVAAEWRKVQAPESAQPQRNAGTRKRYTEEEKRN